MRVVICWSGISGYMAACWRALAARGNFQPLILCFAGQKDTQFAEQSLVEGLNIRFLADERSRSAEAIRDLILEHRAEAVSLSGWIYPAFLQLAKDPALAKVRFVMAMDTPLQRTWRQQAARFKIGNYVRRMHRVIVAGERCWQYAKYLGVAEQTIVRGTYGFDEPSFAPVHAQRLASAQGWPRRFLFVGRYVEEKGLDVLLNGYRMYREASGGGAWGLSCCGTGPLKSQIVGEGVEDLRFVQPAELPAVMRRHGAFVLPSRYEPWGVVVAEAAAAGMPLVCSEAVGASVELVRSYFNGLTVATDDAAALAGALRWVNDNYDHLPEMGARSRVLAAAFSASMWAERWERAFARTEERA